MKNFLRCFFVSCFLISPAIGYEKDRKKNFKACSSSVSLITSLEDALRAAYYYNVDLEAQRVALKQVAEGVALANSEWNPSLSVKGDHRSNFNRGRERNVLNFRRSQSARSQYRGNRTNLSLRAKQNLYSGGGTLARQEKSDAEFKAAMARLTVQEQNTFIKLIEAYMHAVVAQEVLDLEKKNENYFKGLLDQAKVRYEVGDQRLADVATAKAELASAGIAVCKAQAKLSEKRCQLQALINIPLAARLKMPSYYKKNPRNIETLKSIAFKNHPLIIEGCYKERAARYETASVFSNLLPKVDVTAGIGPSVHWRDSQRFPEYRSTRSKNITREADVMISVNIPLVTGGGVQSKYRKSELEVKKARLKSEGHRRSIDQLCHSYFLFFESSQQKVVFAKEALDSNQTALQAARTEYDLGLLTLLDMIRIERNWISSYRSYITLSSDLVTYSYKVLQLTGKLTARDLGLNVCLYDPYVYYNQYRDAWFDLGKDETKTPLFSSDTSDSPTQ